MTREEANLLTKKNLVVALLAALLSLSMGQTNPGSTQTGPADSHTSNLADQGVFLLSVAGRTLGTEKFEIRSFPDKVEAQAEIHLRLEQGGKTSDVKTLPHLTLDRQLHPLTYTWSQKGAQSSQLEVNFRSSPVEARYKTINGQEDRRDFGLPKDVTVLDDNVLHHYQLMVDRYRLTGGGKQTFRAFIPQEALPGVVTVEDLGQEAANIDGAPFNLGHLVVTSELARIDLWVDGQQRLQRVSIPSAQFEAIRKK